MADTGWSIRDEYTRRLANGAWAHHSSKSLLIAVKGPIASSDAALADADATAAGFQVDQAPGANVVKVVVTAEDGSTTETYAVTVARGRRWTSRSPPTGASARRGRRRRAVPAAVRELDRAHAGLDRIADYNAHVQAAAAAGHADIQPFADQFRAVGSTADVNVRLTH